MNIADTNNINIQKDYNKVRRFFLPSSKINGSFSALGFSGVSSPVSGSNPT